MMGNVSKDKLWGLFRNYLIRKEKESHASYSSGGYRCGGISTHPDYSGYTGVIYFYEWSDLNRAPILFYSIPAFINFLDKSNISIPPFQKDMIKNLDKAYITCKKGKTDLLIRGTRPGLLEAFEREDAPGVSIEDLPNRQAPAAQLALPYHVQCCYPPGSPQRMSPMYSYNGNPDEWYG